MQQKDNICHVQTQFCKYTHSEFDARYMLGQGHVYDPLSLFAAEAGPAFQTQDACSVTCPNYSQIFRRQLPFLTPCLAAGSRSGLHFQSCSANLVILLPHVQGSPVSLPASRAALRASRP